MMHINVGDLAIIGPDNGFSPGQRQAIIWTNAGILLIEPLPTNLSKISIKIHTFSFKEIHLKMSSAKWRPYLLCLNVLKALSYELIKPLWHGPRWPFCLPDIMVNTDVYLAWSETRGHSSAKLVRGHRSPDSKVHGANMGPFWGRQDPGGPHVGPMNFDIWEIVSSQLNHEDLSTHNIQ